MQRRLFLASTLVLSILIVAALSGCVMQNPPAAGSSASMDASSTALVEPVKLSFLFAQSNMKENMKALFEKFEAENPGYTIDVQTIPDNQWLDVLKTKIATNETPDLARIDLSKFTELRVDKHFVEIDPTTSWVSRIIPAVLSSKQYNGKLYGVPIGSDTAMGIMYNNDLFEKYKVSVPKTYDELLAVAEVFKQNGITPIYATDKDTWTTCTWFTSIAPQVVDGDTWDKLITNQVKWTDYPEFVDVLDKQLLLYKKGYMNKDSITTKYESMAKALADGSAAMAIAGEWLRADIIKINEDADIRIAPLPVGAGKLALTKGGGVMAIFKNSKHIEQTKIFLDWLSKPENMDIYSEANGDLPNFKDQAWKLTKLQQDIKAYIDAGKVEYEAHVRVAPIDCSELWTFEQAMVGGSLSPQQVMEKWQASFEKQAKLRQLPGF